jgi:hypothetical protein
VVIAAPAAALIAVSVAAIPIEAVGTLGSVGVAALGVEVAFDPFDFWGATPGQADQLIPDKWRQDLQGRQAESAGQTLQREGPSRFATNRATQTTRTR